MEQLQFHLPQKQQFDAIVIGSGMTGGLAAKELTELGLETLVLERGPLLQPPKSAPIANAIHPTGQFKKNDYPIQSQCYLFKESTVPFFVNDKKYPYKTSEKHPFSWIRGYHVGGRSVTWGRQCYRWSKRDFLSNLEDGYGVDWPIRYEDIAPWYDYVELQMGISGMPEGFEQIPDGYFMPAWKMYEVETHIRDAILKKHPSIKMTIGRCANITQDLDHRRSCVGEGTCEQGCLVGGYYSSFNSSLYYAAQTGKLSLRPNSIVHSLEYDALHNRVKAVNVIDAETHQTYTFEGKVVFLCASTLGTTQILLNSTSKDFPNGLANSSGVLGKYLMDHVSEVGVYAEFPAYNHIPFPKEVRPNGIYIPRFRNWDKKTNDFLRGYGMQGGSWRETLPDGKQGPWVFVFGPFGECLPYKDNYVTLDKTEKDSWGIPLLNIHCYWHENELKMREDMVASGLEFLELAGGENIKPFRGEKPPGIAIHEMGTARMGRNPQTSVLNKNNQAHDVPNLFVTDGACMASSACQNPTITYMALTARACHFVAEQLQAGKFN